MPSYITDKINQLLDAFAKRQEPEPQGEPLRPGEELSPTELALHMARGEHIPPQAEQGPFPDDPQWNPIEMPSEGGAYPGQMYGNDRDARMSFVPGQGRQQGQSIALNNPSSAELSELWSMLREADEPGPVASEAPDSLDAMRPVLSSADYVPGADEVVGQLASNRKLPPR